MNKKILCLVALALALVAPFVGYPVFLMKLLCFGLFACAFNLLIGFTGLLSFGHAAFFGSAGYAAGYVLSQGMPFELGILAGVLAAPVINVTPLMGSNLIIVVFAVVVIGGMGSILGSILTGLGLGVIEGLTRVFYPEGSEVVVFVVMVIVLLLRPAGLFGKEK